MVRSIAVFSGKGGVGKTTIAATLAQIAGLTLIDADPQCSSLDWAELREAKTPEVVSSPLVRLPKLLEQLPGCVIDLPGALVGNVAPVLAAVDLVLLVTGDRQHELNALPQSLELVAQAGTPCHVILNRLHPFSDPAPVVELVQEIGGQVAPVYLRERAAHYKAASQGLTAVEFEPDGAAAAEVLKLWDWIGSLPG